MTSATWPFEEPVVRPSKLAAPAHRLYVHLAWTTLGRLPLVGPGRRAATETHLLALCRWLDVEPIETCVLRDRAHLLIRFRPGQSLVDLVRRLQEGSEAILTRAGHPVRWSRRFAAVTVSPTEVRRVRRRIARRAEAARSPERAVRTRTRSSARQVDAAGGPV